MARGNTQGFVVPCSIFQEFCGLTLSSGIGIRSSEDGVAKTVLLAWSFSLTWQTNVTDCISQVNLQP